MHAPPYKPRILIDPIELLIHSLTLLLVSNPSVQQDRFAHTSSSIVVLIAGEHHELLFFEHPQDKNGDSRKHWKALHRATTTNMSSRRRMATFDAALEADTRDNNNAHAIQMPTIN